MTKLVTSWKSLPVAFILVATAAAPALSQQGSPRDDVQHQVTYKLAQGQSGLDGGNVDHQIKRCGREGSTDFCQVAAPADFNIFTWNQGLVIVQIAIHAPAVVQAEFLHLATEVVVGG